MKKAPKSCEFPRERGKRLVAHWKTFPTFPMRRKARPERALSIFAFSLSGAVIATCRHFRNSSRQSQEGRKKGKLELVCGAAVVGRNWIRWCETVCWLRMLKWKATFPFSLSSRSAKSHRVMVIGKNSLESFMARVSFRSDWDRSIRHISAVSLARSPMKGWKVFQQIFSPRFWGYWKWWKNLFLLFAKASTESFFLMTKHISTPVSWFSPSCVLRECFNAGDKQRRRVLGRTTWNMLFVLFARSASVAI